MSKSRPTFVACRLFQWAATGPTYHSQAASGFGQEIAFNLAKAAVKGMFFPDINATVLHDRWRC
jgi:hypothetical protein